ncbi:regulatory protein, yteA family [Pseudomonas aeruginosa]|uniref:TraR/DksA C4-type zinc finger protein n=1 Tax=Pseudomonas aeruginosa TaxID=287 RepID=UPI000658CD00|nr:TraR/DksA C4-type zinc finger protein [Pseudomonas aeruginosa]CRR08871.1 regulatory protein, yteA family [Pseudomonas aeruginosa]
MSAFDPATALETLATEYAARAAAIRRDLARSHSPDFAEQAVQRQNDEVLEGLLAEAEAGMRQVGLAVFRRRQVGLARLRLAEGRYGQCERCGEAIEPARLAALPAAEYCLRCADLVHR